MTFFSRRKGEKASGAATIPAEELPQASLAFCATHGLHPVPAVYETVYVYLSGGNEALNLAFAGELARGPLRQSVILHLHGEYLASGTLAREIGEIGAGLGREVEQMTDVVNAGIEAGSTAKSELMRLTEVIDAAMTPSALATSANELREIGLRQIAANVQLRETLRVTRSRLNELETDLARHMEEANTDHLTKLPNRRAFDARLARAFEQPFDAQAPGCLVMLDIDRFKALNDTHGHDIGDSVIRMVAGILAKHMGQRVHPARWGGEEFAILFDGVGHRAALSSAEQIRKALEEARWTRKKDGVGLGVITASFGIAERQSADTPASLAKRADAALYRAKSDGRNRCAYLATLALDDPTAA